MARNKMLAFKRIDNHEFPLRQIPLDNLDILADEDGFDHILTASSSITTSSQARNKAKKKSKKDQTVEVLQKSYFLLCFVSMNQIEAYLKEYGYLGGNQSMQNEEISQLSKSIMSRN
jgi:hypothetical protein